jgi:hypothetical protein
VSQIPETYVRDNLALFDPAQQWDLQPGMPMLRCRRISPHGRRADGSARLDHYRSCYASGHDAAKLSGGAKTRDAAPSPNSTKLDGSCSDSDAVL